MTNERSTNLVECDGTWLESGIYGRNFEVSDYYLAGSNDYVTNIDDWSCKGDTDECAAKLADLISEYITGVQAHAHEGTITIEPQHECPPEVSPWPIMATVAVGVILGWVVGRMMS